MRVCAWGCEGAISIAETRKGIWQKETAIVCRALFSLSLAMIEKQPHKTTDLNIGENPTLS